MNTCSPRLLFLLVLLLTGAFSASAATLSNAWQFAGFSGAAGNFSYSTNLTPEHRIAANNNGWRFSVVSRLVQGSGTAGGNDPAHFVTYGNGAARFRVGWDTNALGQLTAQLMGSSPLRFVLSTNAAEATNAYHLHDIIYDPINRLASYQLRQRAI